jgi:hypothetical protein
MRSQILLRAVACAAFSAVTACISDGAEPPEMHERSETTAALETAFFDSQAFDADLSDAMKADPEVIVVEVPVAFHLNEIPERMDKWLYAVKDSGGEIELRPTDPIAERSAAAAVQLGVALYRHLSTQLTYRPARSYEAVVFYNADGTEDYFDYPSPPPTPSTRGRAESIR